MYYMYFFPKCFATSKLLGTVFQPSLRPLDWRHIVQRIVRGPQEAAGHAMRRSCCGSITSNEATRQGQLQSRLTGCLREKGREELKTCLFFGWEMFFFWCLSWTEVKKNGNRCIEHVVYWNILYRNLAISNSQTMILQTQNIKLQSKKK